MLTLLRYVHGAGGQLISTIASGLFPSGAVQYRVPVGIGEAKDFYVEIADM